MGNSYNTPQKLAEMQAGKSSKFKSPGGTTHPVAVPKGAGFTPGPSGSVGARAVDVVLPDSFAESRFFSAPTDQHSRSLNRGNQSPSVQTRPTVIRWKGGGRDVSVALEGDNFSYRIPLSMSENEFHTILELGSGRTRYRFYVDGEWKTARDQPVELWDDGGMTNFVELSEKQAPQLQDALLSGRTSPFGEYSRNVPAAEDYARAKDPPGLPAHLEGALLNHPPTSDDSSELPIPAHVVLNHLYSAVRTDGVLLFSMSHRYRSKFTTTVFYTKPAHMTVKADVAAVS